MSSLKLVILGANGQVGHELQNSLKSLGDVIALDRTQADLTKLQALKQTLLDLKPDVIINAAACTAVDKAEDEQELTMLVNGTAPGIIAEAAKQLDALLIHYSTDYVFDGSKSEPYIEDDIPNPINVYGKSKLAGEQAIQSVGGNYLVFRTSWVYSFHRYNFLKTILRLIQEREELSIVDDQVGAPTWARTIAEISAQCIQQAINELNRQQFIAGIYHLASQGETSWYGFANEIINQAKNNHLYNIKLSELTSILTEQYPTAARRPKNSRLACTKLMNHFGVQLPIWSEALKICMDN